MSSISSSGGNVVHIRQSGSNIQYSLNQINWTNISWPCTITNTNTNSGFLKIVFDTDITLNSTNSYFICNSNKIQFGSESLKNDGSKPIINIDTVNNYLGLIKNYDDDSELSYSYIYVFNLFVNSINSTLENNCGWIGQNSYCYGATNNYVINCSSNGVISGNECGGILGGGSGCANDTNQSNLKVIGCSSTGNISGNNSGGILGGFCGANRGSNLSCISCWSTGVISGNGSGGIIGHQCGWISGASGLTAVVRVLNCYSTGVISGNNAGGIAGHLLGTSPADGLQSDSQITNCYSKGNITGNNSGGIVGGVDDINIFNCIATISNCYSTGTINGSGNSGGIYGVKDINGTSDTTIVNCYTVGTTTGNKGYIVGNDQNIPTNCYSESKNSGSGWSDTNANTVLQQYPNPVIGTVWISSNINQPYELFMGYNQYTINNITLSPSPALVTNYSNTININNSTNNAIVNGKSYTILYKIKNSIQADLLNNVTINSTTGQISATNESEPGIYTIYIRNNESNGYSINQMTLTIQNNFPIPCLTEDTKVLTPNGYVDVDNLNVGDYVTTSDNRNVQIKYIFYSIVEGNKRTYPCIIHKNSINKNYPSETFTISRHHMIKYNNIWIHPGSHFPLDKSQDLIKYYHIKLENYLTDHLVINDGVVVESLGNIFSDNISLPLIKKYSIEYTKRLKSVNTTNNKFNTSNTTNNRFNTTNTVNNKSLKLLQLLNKTIKPSI